MSSGVDPRRFADSYTPNFGLDWVAPRPAPSPAELATMTTEQLTALWKAKELRSKVEGWVADNPVGNGWVLPSWRKVMQHWVTHPIHIILGGVRSTKSTLASRLCVWGLGTIPEAQIRCYHVNSERSIQDQQPFVWTALPTKLRHMPTKRSATHTIQYTQANGFTGDKLILPPLQGWSKGGECLFSNYKSYTNDPQTAEGFRAHIIWGDEEMPLEMFRTLLYRLTDFHGRIVLTFTTLNGYTPLVQDILGRTRTIEARYSPHVKREVPVLQESLSREGAIIHYFWTEDNPWLDADEFRKKLRGRPEEEVLAYAHGIPTKAAMAVFRKFTRETNVVKHDDLPFVKNPEYAVTRYMIMDPGGAKSDYIVWVAIDAAGTYWVYREFPDHATYGEWALPGPTPEGKAGPAQKSLSWGIKESVENILNLEGDEKIFERLVDPRMGAAERKGEEGATTIISDFDGHDIVLVPAPGLEIRHGIRLIEGLLNWDETKPRDSRNSPKLYVSDRCENFIVMMLEWSNYSSTEHYKEGPDVLRYLVTSQPVHVAAGDTQAQGSTGSY